MEAREIFELILRADDALKYATEDKLPARSKQARDLLERARDEARSVQNEGLVQQAEQRLADLDSITRRDEPPPASR
ncbi:MAG TPA: hypothetical protein VKK30_00715 [Actinomycetota bacterium]|nr:hypothetical protein [Actinomycetota bacterium]